MPFKIKGAIELENQAQFHPRKYMYGLVMAIERYGGCIFNNSLVIDVQKINEEYITYTNMYNIKSKYVVVCSHYPFINFPGFYFSKMYQVTSYVLGIETEEELFDGMYINSNEPTFSFRTSKYDNGKNDNKKRLLIVAGGDHKTGYSPDSEEFYGYNFLENEIRKIYFDYKILYKWSTEDCITFDKVPYIGEYSHLMPNMFVATGFKKWGMTLSNVAANIISDSILCEKNEFSKIYNSTRFEPIKNKTEMKNMAEQAFKSFVSNRIKIPEESLDVIKNDNGGIIRINGDSVGIYKDGDGEVFAVNPTCTHLGCLLTWNNLEKTWDCPCHGSRFDYYGRNIYGPAFKDLKTYEIED